MKTVSLNPNNCSSLNTLNQLSLTQVISSVLPNLPLITILTTLLTLILTTAQASKANNIIHEVNETSETKVTISSKDLNRIKVIGDKIKHVKFSEDKIITSSVDELGDLYIMFQSEEPANLFLITERGYTYKLLLNPKNIPSSSIFLKNSDLEEVSSSNNSNQHLNQNLNPNLNPNLPTNNHYNTNPSFGSDTEEKQQILELIKAMQNNTIPESSSFKYEIHPESGTYLKSKEIIATKLKTYKGETLTGFILKVKNKTDEDIILPEKLFDREGVRAVLLDSNSDIYNTLPKSGEILGYVVLQSNL